MSKFHIGDRLIIKKEYNGTAYYELRMKPYITVRGIDDQNNYGFEGIWGGMTTWLNIEKNWELYHPDSSFEL